MDFDASGQIFRIQKFNPGCTIYLGGPRFSAKWGGGINTGHISNFEYYDEIFGQVSCLVVFRVGKLNLLKNPIISSSTVSFLFSPKDLLRFC